MSYAIAVAVIGAILFIVRHLMAKARVDQIINSLPVDHEKEQQFKSELEKLNQEIQDADIRYSNAKRALKPTNSSDGSPK